MIVMKFGGSSLESAAAIGRVAGIVASRADRRPAVVVSAMGKTTDRLVELARLAAAGDVERAIERLEALRQYHLAEALPTAPEPDRQGVEEHFSALFEQLGSIARGLAALGELTPRSLDLILSFGERLSSFVVAAALRGKGVDALSVDSRTVVVTDERHGAAAPLTEPTRRRLRTVVAPLVEQGQVPVLGGFIGATQAGVTSTLGRGGSDYSASLVGGLLEAEEVQIWTDVDGVLTADPSLIADAHRIRVMSFGEAAELAYFGAKVLHPSTMAPALERNIPIRVVNSRRPDVDGTLITAEPPASKTLAKSIAYKEGITIVEVRSTRMLMAHGFLARLFEVFDKHATPVDMVTTSEVSVSLTVDKPERLDAIIAELGQAGEVSRRNGRAIVCVVGEGIRRTCGVSAKIFTALADLPIEMISVGASRLNISFVVAESDLAETVRRLHREFFADPDPALFC